MAEQKKIGRPTKEEAIRKRYQEIAKPGETKPKQKRPNRSKSMRVQTDNGAMSDMLTHTMAFRNMARWLIDRHNPEEMEGRLNEYMTYCIEHNVRPTVETMALAYGVDRNTIAKWKNGELSMPESCAAVIRNGYSLMNAIMTQCLVDGKINPISAFFLLKNNHGYKDQTDVAVSVQNPYSELNAEDVRNKYIEGMPDTIPVDGDVK